MTRRGREAVSAALCFVGAVILAFGGAIAALGVLLAPEPEPLDIPDDLLPVGGLVVIPPAMQAPERAWERN